MKKAIFALVTLTAVNAFLACMLGFQQTTTHAQQGGQPPFANSVAQRNEMIQQLRTLNDQLREQNELLRSGQLRIVIEEAP